MNRESGHKKERNRRLALLGLLLVLGHCLGPIPRIQAQTLRSTRVPVQAEFSFVQVGMPGLLEGASLPGLPGTYRVIEADYHQAGGAEGFTVWCILTEQLTPEPGRWSRGLAILPGFEPALSISASLEGGQNLLLVPRAFGPHPESGLRYWYVFRFAQYGLDTPGLIARFIKDHQGLAYRNTRYAPARQGHGWIQVAGFFPAFLGTWH